MSRKLQDSLQSPIAIVGVGCRFPKAKDADAFWSLIEEGQVTFQEIPKERWDHTTFYSDNQRDIDKSWTASGSFIEEFQEFAALHYGIAPRRLEVMDPQQRLLIESTRWAIQDAGYERRGFDRRRTGVFFGVSVSEFKNIAQSRVHAMQLAGGDFGPPAGNQELRQAILGMAARVAPMRAFHLSGSLTALAAASVAQTFDLGGPAYIIDSACASASIAVHDAMLNLRTGALDYAVAGGVYLNLSPDNLVAFTKIGAISPEGICRPFDHRSSGFVQSDGVGVLMLRRLDDAIRDGDRIHAVLIGTGCNNDGRGEGPMTPRTEGQVEVLNLAYADAGISPGSVAYFEAHGTATSIGDPVEVKALGEVLNRTAKTSPAWIGSVKGNIGHAMSAAGIAGLIKAIKIIQHQMVPPQPGFEKLNPRLEMDQYPLKVSTKRHTLEAVAGHPLRVAVSSFGFGGTNSHLILEAPPISPRTTKVAEPLEIGLQSNHEPQSAEPEAIIVTAGSLSLLAIYLEKLAKYISEGDGRKISLADFAFTLNARRDHERYRAVIGAQTPADLIQNLQTAAAAIDSSAVLPLTISPHAIILDAGPVEERRSPKIAYLFPGQGAQQTGLLAGIRDRFPAFAHALNQFEESLSDLLVKPLSSYLYPNKPDSAAEAELTRTEVCQPAMAAANLALLGVLNEVGIQAHVSLGHSLGEFSALSSAGVLNTADTVRLVAQRGQAMNDLDLKDTGSMAAIMTDKSTTMSAIKDINGVEIANVNHPRQVSISGTTTAVEQACETLVRSGHDVRKLNVSHAFHSPLMEGIRSQFRECLAPLHLDHPRHIVASCVASEVYTADAGRTRLVLEDHATTPVDFVRGLHQASEAGADLYIQVGAGTTLLSFVRATLGKNVRTIALAPFEDDRGYMFIRAMCTLAALGVDINFEALYGSNTRRVATLPETPLVRQKYWVIKEQTQPLADMNHALPKPSTPSVHVAASPTDPSAINDAIEKQALSSEMITLFEKQAEIIRTHAAILSAQNQLLLGNKSDTVEKLLQLPLSTDLEVSGSTPSVISNPSRIVTESNHRQEMASPPPLTPMEEAPRPTELESATVPQKVLDIISKISAFPKDSIRKEQKLVDELGFDSLMVADLGGAIEAQFPAVGALPPTLFSLETTVGDIADHLVLSLQSTPAEQVSTDKRSSQLKVDRYTVLPLATPRTLNSGHKVRGETWLVTEDGSKLSAEISKALVKHEVQLIRIILTQEDVSPPAAFSFSAPNLWPEKSIEALAVALERAGIQLNGYIHAAGFSVSSTSADPIRPIRLLHPLASAFNVERLGVVLSLGGNLGLTRTASLRRNLLQTVMLGYAKALRRERPRQVVRCLDIDPHVDSKKNAQWIVEELLSDDTCVEVGFDGAQRLIPHLSVVESTQTTRTLGTHDVVLITGGAGEIGSVVARWAVGQHPKGVIIAGRRPANAQINQLLSELSSAKCTVAYVSADVTKPEALEGATRVFVDRVGKVTVAIHAAGVIEDALVENKTLESIQRVMNTKIRGAQALVQAFPELRDLILFSSWAGRFGNARQADYSAANELLDRLAVAGTGSTRTISIGWPPWSDTQMVTSIPESLRHMMEHQGVTFLTQQEGLAVFRNIFESQARGMEIVGRDLPKHEWSVRVEEFFDLQRHPYLEDHRLNGQPVVPLASVIDWIVTVFQQQHPHHLQPVLVENLKLARGIMGDQKAILYMSGRVLQDGTITAEVEVTTGPDKIPAYRAQVRSQHKLEPIVPIELSGPPSTAPLTLNAFYNEYTFHGPMLRGIKRLNRSTDAGISGIVKASNPKTWWPDGTRTRWSVDPLIVDGSFQLAGYWLHTHHRKAGFPTGLGRLTLFRPFGREVHCTVRLEQVNEVGFSGHIWYADAEGQPYACLENIQGRFADLDAGQAIQNESLEPQAEEAQPTPIVLKAEIHPSGRTNGLIPRNGHDPAVRGAQGQDSKVIISPPPNAESTLETYIPEVPEESWKIAEFPEVKALAQRFEMAKLVGLDNPYFSVHAGTARDTSVVDGKELVHFSGYNYLGFSGRAEVVASAQEAAGRYGTSVSASRVASGERPIHRELEQGIAEHLGVDDAILYVSGHATNVTTVGHILDKEDLVIHDALIHDSIFQGIKLSGAARRPFAHNSIDSLEHILANVRSNFRRVLICVEGIYSMDGDICDLPNLLRLKKKYQCLLLVDEAHSIGVLGHQGRGVGHHFRGLNPRDVDLWMGTLSKSFASVGGYIAGSTALIEYLKYTAPGFVYSVGLAPPNVAAAMTSLQLMQQEPEVVERLRSNSLFFLKACKKLGLDTGLAAGAAVVPVIVGDSLTCMQLSSTLKEKGINVQPIVYPAVEDESSRLRFFISSLHSEEQLLFAAQTTRDALDELRSVETDRAQI